MHLEIWKFSEFSGNFSFFQKFCQIFDFSEISGDFAIFSKLSETSPDSPFLKFAELFL